ncbi:MAG: lectin like domain-containing protein [Candidatus Delongbacteria bacterium]|jgi:C1A family cysteine protease|nr:lectin like domain-containing protein [Candidatus Delongbacteria bacterium]
MKNVITTVIVLFAISIFAQDWSKENSIFIEDFEDEPLGSGGWSMQTTGAGWRHFNLNPPPVPHSGDYHMSHFDDVGSQDDWLISPIISIPSEENILLSFWETSLWVDYIGAHEVCVTTDGGITWTQISSTVPEELIYNQVFSSLNDFVGQDIQIGWHYIGDYSDQWFIDDIEVFVSEDPPLVTKLYANRTVLPILGTFINEDMIINLGIYDKTNIQNSIAHYTFDGGVTYTDINMAKAKGDEFWQAVIPARDSVSTGSIYFDITNISEITLTTGSFVIEFIEDTWAPKVVEVIGSPAEIRVDAVLILKLSDHSDISSCEAHYSTDGFVTEQIIQFDKSKVNYDFRGTIPAEIEVTNGEIKFYIYDEFGNEKISSIYPVDWIESLPVSFDLRDYSGNNYVTSVKSQRGGTCWTFGAMSAIESNLLKTGKWVAAGEIGEPDLSEYHLSWWCGFNEYFNGDLEPPTGDGLPLHMRGDYLLTAAYLSRGEGAVRDIDAPDFSYTINPDRFSDNYHYYYPRNIEWYVMDYDLTGINLIKKKIIEHGAIGTSLVHTFVGNDYIHYQPESDPIYITHAVTIVGWDDDFITQAPEGAGAWLCKNSYGTDWGFSGYFWASYYTKHVAKEFEGGAISFQDVELLKYEKIFYHDYHGWSDTMNSTDEAFNAFTTTGIENLTAVSFFTSKNNVSYSVEVYDYYNGAELQNLLSSTSGHIDYRGFHTVDLPNIVELAAGDDFYIYLYLSDGGQPYDQSSYIPSAFLTYQSSASSGESFYKEDGIWKDLYDNIAIKNPRTANFCIKGLCDDSLIYNGEIRIKNYELEQNYPNPFNPNTIINFLVPQNDSKLKLVVYNVNGQLVSTLFDGIKNKGKHSINFNASALNSGVYYYTLEVDGVRQDTKKMVMIK